jgi:hypothetical protein
MPEEIIKTMQKELEDPNIGDERKQILHNALSKATELILFCENNRVGYFEALGDKSRIMHFPRKKD